MLPPARQRAQTIIMQEEGAEGGEEEEVEMTLADTRRCPLHPRRTPSDVSLMMPVASRIASITLCQKDTKITDLTTTNLMTGWCGLGEG